MGQGYTKRQQKSSLKEYDNKWLNKALLRWYDRARRDLPWRAKPGVMPDPYRVWLSEIMLQQTTVQTVAPYFEKFLERWPRLQDLAKAKQEDVLHAWAGLGYYARGRNLHACAQVLMRDYAGRFPDTIEGLRALPGIGPYTAGAIAAIAFNKPYAAVDGNVERVLSRLYALQTPLPDLKKEIWPPAQALVEAQPKHAGDTVQALMDLGATICTPKAPRCVLCPWVDVCAARAKGITADLPRRAAKAAKPQKHGTVFIVRDRQGQVLLERRPAKGLLAGMPGLPTGAWRAGKAAHDETSLYPEYIHKTRARDASRLGQVRHVFTHFDLYLDVYTLPAGALKKIYPKSLYWVSYKQAPQAGLPTVFAKALRLLGDIKA